MKSKYEKLLEAATKTILLASVEGPHTVKDAPDSRCFLISNEATVIAQIIFNPAEGDDVEQCRADARLLTHSLKTLPQLLESVRRYRKAVSNLETMERTSCGTKLEHAREEMIDAELDLNAAIKSVENPEV